MPLEFGILGPLTATADGRHLDLEGRRRRRLLAMLLVHGGQTISIERLVDAVWEDRPPANAEATLRAHVAKLRRTLEAAGGADVVVTQPPGYCLQVEHDHVDANRFERLEAAGRAAVERGDHERGAATLRDALALWRGCVLEDLDVPRFVEAEAARLEELRLVALAARIDADLALGRHESLVGELEALVAAHPYREHLCGQLALALYRSGRQADALAVCRSARHRLDDELGLDPGHTLAELETAMLRHEPSLLSRAPPGRSARSRERPPRQPPDPLLDVVRRVPMVGRTGELARLTELWEAVRAGGRRVALVSGEAGVGKTRLVAELAQRAVADGATLLVGRCEPDTAAPYQPVADALRASADALEAFAEAPEPVRNRMGRLLDRHEEHAFVARSQPESLQDERTALLDAATELLARLTAAAPVVLVIEEAEALDQASARLLRHLVRRPPEGLLLVVCFRDPAGRPHEPLRELLTDLEGRGLADPVTLEPLSAADLRELVAAWIGVRASDAFVHGLWASTGGNPFYAGEVVRDLAARGTLDSADQAWRVPTGVRHVLRERLHTLPEPVQAVITGAAVLGRAADHALLGQVAGASDVPVGEALEHATRAGWLLEAGGVGRSTYVFRHALMREAVHADIPAHRRTQLHLRAADALEAVGLRNLADVAAAARHLRAAGPLAAPERTAAMSRRAADRAEAVFAWEEAIEHAEAAVAILAEADAPPATQAEAATRTADLLEKSSIDYHRAVAHLEAALEQHRVAGDETAVAMAHSRLGRVLSVNHRVMDIPRALDHFAAAERVLTGGKPAFDVQFGAAMAAGFGLWTEPGDRATQRARDLAARLGRRELIGWSRANEACYRFYHGDLAAEHALRAEAWAAAHDRGDPHLGWEVVTCGAVFVHHCLLDPGAAQAWCRRGLTQPRLDTIAYALDAVGDQLASTLLNMGEVGAARDVLDDPRDDAVTRRQLLLVDGDWEAAEASWAGALADDLARGNRLNAILNACWLGQARRLLGRTADAAEALQQGLAISLDGPFVPGEVMARAELARVLVTLGEHDAATEHVARCDKILAAGEDWRGRAGAVELARGVVAAAQTQHERGRGAGTADGGQHELGDAAYARALEVFTTYRLPWWRAETLHAWASGLACAGRTREAEAKHRAAWTLYGALGADRRWRRAPAAG